MADAFLKEMKKYFKTESLYEALELPKEGASELPASAIKKAYYRAALRCHPDRVKNDAEATRKFQIIGKIYETLGDDEKRKIYDETGVIGDVAVSFDGDWIEHFLAQYRKVTAEDILDFEKEYKGSQEEKDDIKRYYNQFKGDMDAIMENVFFITLEDEDRLRSIVQQLIDDKQVKAFSAFTSESAKKKVARKKRWLKEAKEAKKYSEEVVGKKDASFRDLADALRKQAEARNKKMKNLFAAIEHQYGSGSGKSKNKKNDAGVDPSKEGPRKRQRCSKK